MTVDARIVIYYSWVDVEAMKRNYSKEDFVWILENLILVAGYS